MCPVSRTSSVVSFSLKYNCRHAIHHEQGYYASTMYSAHYVHGENLWLRPALQMYKTSRPMQQTQLLAPQDNSSGGAYLGCNTLVENCWSIKCQDCRNFMMKIWKNMYATQNNMTQFKPCWYPQRYRAMGKGHAHIQCVPFTVMTLKFKFVRLQKFCLHYLIQGTHHQNASQILKSKQVSYET